MSTSAPLPRLRTLRRKWGLTQGELARLINSSSAANLSRFEHGQCQLKFDVLAAYAVVFGKSLAELEPQRFKKVEERVSRAAKKLLRELRRDHTARAFRKRELLLSVLKRAGTGHSQHGA